MKISVIKDHGGVLREASQFLAQSGSPNGISAISSDCAAKQA
jgi:hypothetical protein